MPKKMATKKSNNAYMITRFNDFMGLLGLSPKQQQDSDAGVEAVVPAECKKCENYGDFYKCNIPYSCKLLFQELQCMSIYPRISLK